MVSGEDTPLACRQPPSGCGLMAFSLCACGEKQEISGLSSSPYKDIDFIGLEPHPYDFI